MPAVEVITSVERRRRWSREEKLRIVAESARPYRTVSQVARTHGIALGQLFTWRRQLLAAAIESRGSDCGFVPVIDDGIATGATTRAALTAGRARGPRKLILAVPVAPKDTLALMRELADDVVCLEQHDEFGAIGFFYSDFRQTSDREVIEILARYSPHGTAKTKESAA